jgi:hypothetical protein
VYRTFAATAPVSAVTAWIAPLIRSVRGAVLVVVGGLSRVGAGRRREAPERERRSGANGGLPAPDDDPVAAPASVAGRHHAVGRSVAALALFAVVGVAVAAVLAAFPAGHGRQGGSAAGVARTAHSSTLATSVQTHAVPPPTRVRRPTPVSPALASKLEASGHTLLEAGRYGVAIGVLKRAVLATGEHVGACLNPGTQTCLTYAFALYDLGRALRLSGHPDAAVPILERRLQIDNQRPIVAAELELARQEALSLP